MGYSIEEISSSDSFTVHSVVQCCCSWKCCNLDILKNEKISCSTCDLNKEKKKKKKEKEKYIPDGLVSDEDVDINIDCQR